MDIEAARRANTPEALSRFWADPITRRTYYTPARLLHFELVANYIAETGILQNAKRVIDLGCGSGMFAPYLKKISPEIRYTGVDYALGAIEWARSSNSICGTFLVGDICNLHYPDNTFDIAFCIQVLEHIKNYQAALDEMQRIVKPGGHIVITVPDGSRDIDPAHVNKWSLSRLKRLPPEGSKTYIAFAPSDQLRFILRFQNV